MLLSLQQPPQIQFIAGIAKIGHRGFKMNIKYYSIKPKEGRKGETEKQQQKDGMAESK